MSFLKTRPNIQAVINQELARQRDKLNDCFEILFLKLWKLKVAYSDIKVSGKRYYGGCENVDVIETLAIERASACSVQNMPMYNLTLVLKQTLACISH
ncbi:MAG: hypothetical protein ACLR5T_04610 [Veillonella sp.]